MYLSGMTGWGSLGLKLTGKWPKGKTPFICVLGPGSIISLSLLGKHFLFLPHNNKKKPSPLLQRATVPKLVPSAQRLCQQQETFQNNEKEIRPEIRKPRHEVLAGRPLTQTEQSYHLRNPDGKLKFPFPDLGNFKPL